MNTEEAFLDLVQLGFFSVDVSGRIWRGNAGPVLEMYRRLQLGELNASPVEDTCRSCLFIVVFATTARLGALYG